MTIKVIDTVIHFLCPHCGEFTCDEDSHITDGLDCGTMVECPRCGGGVVIDVRTPEERKRAFQDTGAIESLRELEGATYAFALAATVKMNKNIEEMPRLVQALAKARAILQPEVGQ